MAYGYYSSKLGLKGQSGKVLEISELLKKTGGSPVYIYDIDDVLMRVSVLREAFNRPIEIHYAMKANFHPYLLKTLAKAGVGADVVSAGEMKWAMDNGHKADHIVFSGVGKTVAEITQALKADIRQLNVESPAELRRIGEIAKSLKVKARVAFRMNPDVNASTHPYIQTGFRENKFGMDVSFFSELKEILKEFKEDLDFQGLTLHIGSQIRDISALGEAVLKTKTVWKMLESEGYNLKTFDIGGGLGIDYNNFAGEDEMNLIRQYGKMMSDALADIPKAIIQLEPGRILVGRMGLLVSEIQYIKTTPYKNFAIINTGMHHLMRPALYQAHHRILPLFEAKEEHQEVYDIVGPICESSDVIGYDRRLPKLKSGDYLAIADAGAYGYSMASNYNLHALPKELCVHEDKIQE